jgi:hypothetical protein
MTLSKKWCYSLFAISLLVSLIGASTQVASAAQTGSDDPAWSSLPSLGQITTQLASASSQTSLTSTEISGLEGGLPFPDAKENGSQKNCDPQDGTPYSYAPCAYGDLASKRVIVVVGDSEADMWIPTFDIYGKEFGFKIDRFVMDGCAAWKEIVPASIAGWAQCEVKWKAYCISAINKLRPFAVVATGMLQDNQSTEVTENPEIVAAGIDNYFLAIKKSKAKLFVLANIPWDWSISTSPDACVDVHTTKISECDPHIDPTMGAALEVVQHAGYATVVPIKPLFCSAKSCPVVDGNIGLYFDNHHLSHSWATNIPRAFSQIFNPLLGVK